MSEVLENLKNWLDKVYSENFHIACLELPILKILVNHNGWLDRDEIINQLSEYGSFERGSLSFDHLWSQRFGKGEESEILNSLVEHDGENAGDVKTKYKIMDTIDKNEIKQLLQTYNEQKIEAVIKYRLEAVKKIKIWKLAHSHLNDKYQIAIDENIACLGNDTGKNQAENFKKAQVGDLFYLVSSQNPREISLIGKFVNQEIVDASQYRENYIGRKYTVLFNAKQKDFNIDGQEYWKPSGQTTFYEIPKKDYFEFEEKILKPNFGITLDDLNIAVNRKNEDEQNKENKVASDTKQIQPLNQILYGSPGTGKTYHTINKAIEIIENRVLNDEKLKPKNRKALKDKFEEYKNKGQIEFVTFHQSYGYEEFIEGIKAETNGENITYEVKAGIFKELSNRANKNIEQSKENIIIKKEFDVVFKEKILDKLLDNDKLEIKMKKSSFYIKEVDETHISFDKSGGESQHVLLIRNLKLMYEQGENKIIMGGLSQYYNPLLEYLFENSEIKNEEKEPLKNYILIIDEINRGNISKIFGELITLIEPSKRIGADEEIKVKLPYSGKEFGVPKNLYIIGTMNTADRSIAPIDTALRRRFVFEEMAPNPSLLSKEKTPDIYDGVNLKSLLEAINTRIEYLYDRDHTIGHAYLIDVKTLDDLIFVFKNKIIPLLAEYFYEDWENIDLVLNSNGFIISNTENKSYLSKKIQDRIINKTTYKVSDDSTWTKEHFINIYNKNENE